MVFSSNESEGILKRQSESNSVVMKDVSMDG